MARYQFASRANGHFRQNMLYDEHDPDVFTVHTQEEYGSIKDYCARYRQQRNQQFAETMRPVAEIPMMVYQEALLQDEMSTEEYCKRWAMKPENKDFRLSEGSI